MTTLEIVTVSLGVIQLVISGYLFYSLKTQLNMTILKLVDSEDKVVDYANANSSLRVELRTARLHLLRASQEPENPAVFRAIKTYFQDHD